MIQQISEHQFSHSEQAEYCWRCSRKTASVMYLQVAYKNLGDNIVDESDLDQEE